jgi:hypothetical protein
MQKTVKVNKLSKSKENKIALLGDSIFDNGCYVFPGTAVIDHINQLEKKGWTAELLAVDGAITKDTPSQFLKINDEISHLVISIGGNDALGYVGVFEEAVSSVYEGMQYLTVIRDQFEVSYKGMLAQVTALNKKFALCTIYNTCPGVELPLLTALSVFNDVIFKEAFKLGVPVLDFRQTFTDPTDYSTVSPIEPSETGGKKIAKVLKLLMEMHDFSDERSVIYH